MDACSELADAATRLAATATSPRTFLVEFGRVAAGVRRGPLWMLDAGKGGRNHFSGRGFRRPVDDDTDGQARHFAGIVAVSARVGTRLTRILSIAVGGDKPTSADGRLTDQALEFTRLVRSGRLAPGDSGDWIRARLCKARS
ncbi:hypothetical protein [Leifsonia sp. NPDC058230]|uniref:hypothetical protein n=1 Tax=Leifsonia sp. NPDC058230 TaxID=3346391 RepID=UPI0036D96BF7